ncbi:hypothetical protein PR202_ga28641 [Eleusine coracana subsp. coracana]|uniref:Pentatricopeptide repeat-containing protein n=1 Tax=Eleusine coracana subsp. coracana TaxID=191504 RepID=A0AAV5DK04_ELECO|nr:hypothetical protein PR202_ga28641 [Eleusine coracana subsp. coracana]
MLFHGLPPTAHTTIPACSSSPLLGRALHAHAVKLALAADAYVATALLGAYARAGDAAAARKLFDAMQSFPDPPHLDSVTAMITCYAETGALDDARSLFDELPHKDFICACSDEVAVVLALTAVESGRWVHSYVKNNSRRRVRISARVGTALIDMYYKCGSFGGRRRRVRTRPRT